MSSGMNGVNGVAVDPVLLGQRVASFSTMPAGDKKATEEAKKELSSLFNNVLFLKQMFNKNAQRDSLQAGQQVLQQAANAIKAPMQTIEQALEKAKKDDRTKRCVTSHFRSSAAVRELQDRQKFLALQEKALLAEMNKTIALNKTIDTVQTKLAATSNAIELHKKNSSGLLQMEVQVLAQSVSQLFANGRAVSINENPITNQQELFEGLNQLLKLNQSSEEIARKVAFFSGKDAVAAEFAKSEDLDVLKLCSQAAFKLLEEEVKSHTDRYKKYNGIFDKGTPYFVPVNNVNAEKIDISLKEDGSLSVLLTATVELAKEIGAKSFATVDVDMELVKPAIDSPSVTTQCCVYNVNFLKTVTPSDVKKMSEVFSSSTKATVSKVASA